MNYLETLVRYETDLWNLVDRRLRSDGTSSLAQTMVLRVLAGRPGECRVGDIASELRITVGAASKIVDRLERDGLAIRSPDPDDGRASRIRLTPTGTQILETAVAVIDTVATAHLGSAGVKRLSTELRALSERVIDQEKELS